ncbi:hypothetical protein GCM10027422_34950 [Hymenobacter arcticus]
MALEADAYTMLVRISKKLNTHQRNFASAAIRNYAELGLDPTKTSVLMEAAKTRAEINEMSHNMRKLLSQVSDDLTKKLHTLEQDMYRFQMAQEVTMMTYLARIEAGILLRQTTMQTQILTPLVEKILGVGVETHLNRTLLEELLLKFKDMPLAAADLTASSQRHDMHVTLHRVVELRKLMETMPVELTTLAIRPLPTKLFSQIILPDNEPVP